MSDLPLLTVICPVYNEEQTVPLFFGRIQGVFAALAGQYRTNLLFVDNCSHDSTPAVIKQLCATHRDVFSIVLSRNFGYQCSVECGLTNAKGDLFVVIDVDCEDPPELIHEFLKYHREGYDIVYGERLDREEGYTIKAIRRLFYRLTRSIADESFVLDMAEFALITAEVRNAIIDDDNSFPFIRASTGRVGFRRKNIPYKRHRRIAGTTHYNFWRMSVFAVAGILSSSTFLLRLPAYCFPFWLLGMLALGIAQAVVPGPAIFASLVTLGFAFCGLTLVCISIYVARVYKNGLNRPNFIVRKHLSILQ